MNILNNVKGITLVALVVTIIVLLILVGIIFITLNDLIIDKAVIASSKTTESFLKEQVEMAWIYCEASWLEDKQNNQDKNTYFTEKLKENLESIKDFSNVNITGDIENNTKITFKCKNKEYTFEVTSDGKVNLLYLLKGNVKVGDCVEYPIEYDDAYSFEHYTTTTGWRIIDDGVMAGTSGTVKIVSTGIPAKWYYKLAMYENNINAIEALSNNFENIDLIDANVLPIKGEFFKNESIAKKVTTMSLNDYNHAYNCIFGTNRTENDISKLTNKNDLLYIDNVRSYYWLATEIANDMNNIYCVNNGEILEYYDVRMGIRPVIYLDENQTGTLNSNVWKLN